MNTYVVTIVDFRDGSILGTVVVRANSAADAEASIKVGDVRLEPDHD